MNEISKNNQIIPTALKNCDHYSRVSEAGTNDYNSFDAQFENIFGISPPSLDSVFGTITCPECQWFCLEEYVPLNCPQCGTHLSDVEGAGSENMVRWIETANLPTAILECPRCKLRYPQVKTATPQICLRCQIPLVNAAPINNLLRKIAWHGMLLKKSITERL